MRSTVMALTWEIWRRSQRATWLVVGIISSGWLVNQIIPGSFRASESARERLLTVNWLLTVGSFFFVFGIFNYTEFNPRKEWNGFPYRLFVLPVPTWVLVALPMLLGVASVELVYLAWIKLVFTPAQIFRPGWFAVLLGTLMLFYQAILWSLAGSRMLRMIVLGLTGASFIGIAFLPFFAKYISSPWLSEKVLIPLLAGLAIFALAGAWFSVARQRRGGRGRRNWVMTQIERLIDLMPRRSQSFGSPSAAQFWFEWRRAGLLLPVCVGAILLLVIGPLSWLLRHDSGHTVWTLAWTLGMPLLLAAAMGKGFSKPDFWSRDLSLVPFLAVRPLTSGEMVVIKMKVAALSTGVAWLLVLAFVSLWLPLWANPTGLNLYRFRLWLIYGDTHYAIAILSVAAAMLLTWRCLMGSLWVGLSGSRKFFVGFTFLQGGAAVLALLGVIWHSANAKLLDLDLQLSWLGWILALAVIAKLWMAVFSWRKVTLGRVRKYALIWSGGTLCFVVLAVLVRCPPLDVYRLEHLLVLAALLPFPIARLGLAPLSLAKNRHR
jgi:hypothetical protein